MEAWEAEGRAQPLEGRTLSPSTPFVLSDASESLFNAVLRNWTVQACHECRMVLAAPGLYTIAAVRRLALFVWLACQEIKP
jgi:hypothetical protein